MKPPKGPELSESDIQIQLVEYLNLVAAQCGFVFFAVPNEAMGQARGPAGLARMARLKRMGLRPGVADLVFVKAAHVYFLEMKRPGGKIRTGQIEFSLAIEAVGAPYAVAYSFDEAITILKDWSILP